MNKLDNIIAVAGAVVLFVGLILQFVKFEYAPYIYIVGALMFGWIQAKTGRYFGKNIVLKRLKRQQLIGAMLLVIAGVMMIVGHHNEWILCLSVAAVLELYTAYRIPYEEKKEE